MTPRFPSAGFTLIELALLLVLFALLSALAVPSLSRTIAQARSRGALDRLAADLYLARSLAVRSGRPLAIRFQSAEGCVTAYELVDDTEGPPRPILSRTPDSGVCLRSNVSLPMRVNGRGMLVGSPRKLYATSGRASDSISVSIVGRVYRWH